MRQTIQVLNSDSKGKFHAGLYRTHTSSWYKIRVYLGNPRASGRPADDRLACSLGQSVLLLRLTGDTRGHPPNDIANTNNTNTRAHTERVFITFSSDQEGGQLHHW